MISQAKDAPQTESIKEVLLEFVEGENNGVELKITPPRTLTLGRSEQCDIYLGEKKISRLHCEIKVDDQGLVLRDNKSTNGTYINKKKVEGEVFIEHGDRVQLGTTVIKVSITKEALQTRKQIEAQSALQEEESIEHQSPSGLMDAISSVSQPQSKGFSNLSASKTNQLSPDVSKKESFKSEPEKLKPLSGNLTTMSLADLLQTFGQSSKSGVLKIVADQTGYITLYEGKVLACKIGQILGEKAFIRLLSWTNGDFELEPLPQNFQTSDIKNPMTQNVEALLMEGFRQFDEMQKFKSKMPDYKEKLQLAFPLNEPLSKLHPKVLDVLQMVLNHREIQSVLDQSSLSDLETLKVLYYLIHKNYIIAV